jgi:putative SOS response-associated peptidase YedK
MNDLYREAPRRLHRTPPPPVDGFYEWLATKHGKQPYAIAMKDRSPFGIAALWENWKDPAG